MEGSYFGDTDIFIEETTHLERDSTAIAIQESHFFLLSRFSIVELKKIYISEIVEMEELAKRRRAKHKRLIQNLKKKVEQI